MIRKLVSKPIIVLWILILSIILPLCISVGLTLNYSDTISKDLRVLILTSPLIIHGLVYSFWLLIISIYISKSNNYNSDFKNFIHRWILLIISNLLIVILMISVIIFQFDIFEIIPSILGLFISILLLYSLIYCYRWITKSILNSRHKIAQFNDYTEYCLILAIYPIGLWRIHEEIIRINE